MSEKFKVGHCEVTIEQYTTPFSPREDDNVGTMVCWHRRYNLGDEQPDESPSDYLRRLVPGHVTQPYEARRDRVNNNHDTGWGRPKRLPSDVAYALYDRIDKAEEDAIEKWLNDNLVILDLYLHDHGGITMSTGAFSCPWDSGRVGFIYCSLEDARKNWVLPADAGWDHLPDEWWDNGRFIGHEQRLLPENERKKVSLRDATLRMLEGEVKTYDQYLTGDVWGYVVSTPDGKEESCWGFFGQEYCEEEARSVAEHMSERYEKEQARLEMEEAALEQQTELAICWP